MWASKLYWRSQKKHFGKAVVYSTSSQVKSEQKSFQENPAGSSRAETHDIKQSRPGPLELFVGAGVVSMSDACVRS